jgi:hypothetical protein
MFTDRQPITAAAEQLLDLVVAHPVVFLIVEHGDQDVQVTQEILKALSGA